MINKNPPCEALQGGLSLFDFSVVLAAAEALKRRLRKLCAAVRRRRRFLFHDFFYEERGAMLDLQIYFAHILANNAYTCQCHAAHQQNN